MHSLLKPVLLLAACMLMTAESHAHKPVTADNNLEITSTTTTIYNSPSALSLGQNRLIIRANNDAGQAYGGPTKETVLRLTQGATVMSVPTYWVWTSTGYSGFYVANVVFKSNGEWQAQLANKDSSAKSAETTFHVATTSVVPSVGQMAILSDSKTISDNVELRQLTTDDNPNPDFYKLSISDAVKSGKPSVIVFATPDLCRTAVCGPVLTEMKKLAKEWSQVNFVHVEIYQPLETTNNKLVPVPAVAQWQLPSEPWTFLVNTNGRIAAKYEGYITQSEINAALLQLSGS